MSHSRSVCAVVTVLVTAMLFGPSGAGAEPPDRKPKPQKSSSPSPSPSDSPSPDSTVSATPTPSPTDSPSPSPSPTATVMAGTGHFLPGITGCGPYMSFCVYHHAFVTGRVLTGGGSDVGRGVPGVTVELRTDTGDTHMTVTGADGHFYVSVGYYARLFDGSPSTWTASTSGDERYAGSSTSGIFI